MPKSENRSLDCFFVKNLSYSATKLSLENLFKRYGQLELLLMPENKAVAIVKYSNQEHARNAFEIVSGTIYKGSPVYLEWAPIELFPSKVQVNKVNQNIN